MNAATHVLRDGPFLLTPLAQEIISHEVRARARLRIPAHLLLLLHLVCLRDDRSFHVSTLAPFLGVAPPPFMG